MNAKKLLILVVTSLLPLVQAEVSPLPLIVNPPSSSGVNQGFSREPFLAFYDQGKNILVIEQIESTLDESKKGNHTVFHIVEYYIDPKGKELKKTSWTIFEGTDSLANETTISYENIAPYTFREDSGDGKYYIYTVHLASNGEFKRLERTYFDKDGAIQSKDAIFG